MHARTWAVLVCIALGLRLVGHPLVEGGEEKAVIKAEPFDLKQVKLLDGPFKEARERDRRGSPGGPRNGRRGTGRSRGPRMGDYASRERRPPRRRG